MQASSQAGSTDRLLPQELPDGRELLGEGRALGDQVEMGLSLLCKTHGVGSELEYKKKMTAEGRLMTTMNIGMQTWAETAVAMRRIHQRAEELGFRIDRYQMQLDRRMGVPPEVRTSAAKETGPLLETPGDWWETTNTAPIQPQLGDMMIGSPMSVDNASNALRAGINYIGNMSQFAWKYPAWRGTDVDQMCEMVKALGLMASKAEGGAVVQSYLEDGFPGQFSDYGSYVGWALFEHYLVNEVIGANLSVSYGGLTRNPASKVAVTLALDTIRPDDVCTAFYHVNTTAYTPQIDQNYAVLSIDALLLMATQLRTRSGAAILPVPVTEALRIPTWEEIVQVHAIARRVADFVPQVADAFDWPFYEAWSARLIESGRRFFDNLMNGLGDLGVDTGDPLQLLLAVRRLGALEIERRYGGGETDDSELLGYTPVEPTDTYLDFMRERDLLRAQLATRPVQRQRMPKVVVGSSDIHEYALSLVIDALSTLGVEPLVAGTSVDPDELADLALEGGAPCILVSTHNGMALTYAKHLMKEIADRRLTVRVVMGGTLNQDVEGVDAPVDVREELGELGVVVCDTVADLADALVTGSLL